MLGLLCSLLKKRESIDGLHEIGNVIRGMELSRSAGRSREIWNGIKNGKYSEGFGKYGLRWQKKRSRKVEVWNEMRVSKTGVTYSEMNELFHCGRLVTKTKNWFYKEKFIWDSRLPEIVSELKNGGFIMMF